MSGYQLQGFLSQAKLAASMSVTMAICHKYQRSNIKVEEDAELLALSV